MKRIGVGAVLGAALTVWASATLAANGQAAFGVNSTISSDGRGLNESPDSTGASRNFVGDRYFSPKGLLDVDEGDDDIAALQVLTPNTGPDGSDSIIGSDDRVLITNTTKYPYSAVVFIVFEDNEGIKRRCTGALINKNTVVTAGHCVYEAGVTWYAFETYKIFAGRNGKQTPYKKCRATRLYTVTYWALEGRDDYDYGAMKLNCNVGNKAGWFGYYAKSGSFVGKRSIITGYPGDKARTMWRSIGMVTVSEPRRLFYDNDTAGGMGGSPVYHKRSKKCTACMFAIDTYGTYGVYPFSDFNHGTRITGEVVTNFNNWKRALP